MGVMFDLVEICKEARESCFARHCNKCKYSTKGFPECQDYLYADKISKRLEETDDL